MTFLGLFRREVDESELVPEARRIVSKVRRGMTPEQAAALAGVEPEQLREWKRQPAFRHALARAVRDGPLVPRAFSLDDVVNPPSEFPSPRASETQLEDAGWRRL